MRLLWGRGIWKWWVREVLGGGGWMCGREELKTSPNPQKSNNPIAAGSKWTQKTCTLWAAPQTITSSYGRITTCQKAVLRLMWGRGRFSKKLIWGTRGLLGLWCAVLAREFYCLGGSISVKLHRISTKVIICWLINGVFYLESAACQMNILYKWRVWLWNSALFTDLVGWVTTMSL